MFHSIRVYGINIFISYIIHLNILLKGIHPYTMFLTHLTTIDEYS